ALPRSRFKTCQAKATNAAPAVAIAPANTFPAGEGLLFTTTGQRGSTRYRKLPRSRPESGPERSGLLPNGRGLRRCVRALEQAELGRDFGRRLAGGDDLLDDPQRLDQLGPRERLPQARGTHRRGRIDHALGAGGRGGKAD